MGTIILHKPGFLRDRDPIHIKLATNAVKKQVSECGKDLRKVDDMIPELMERLSISFEEYTKALDQILGFLNKMDKRLQEMEHFFNIILCNLDPTRTIITFEERCEVAGEIGALQNLIVDRTMNLNRDYDSLFRLSYLSYD